jgi:hypothetical protein
MDPFILNLGIRWLPAVDAAAHFRQGAANVALQKLQQW